MAASVGDAIAICQGGEVPLLLRQHVAGKVTLVGSCYVYGIMYGERYCVEDCWETSIS